MKFDERHFQMFYLTKRYSPDGVFSNKEVERFVDQILAELTAMSAYEDRSPCKPVLRVANYLYDNVRSPDSLTDVALAFMAVIYGLLRERVSIQPEISVANHLKGIFDEELRARLSIELASIPYASRGFDGQGRMICLADYSSVSVFGKRFEQDSSYEDMPIEFEIIEDPSDEIDKPDKPDEDSATDDPDASD